jgi:S1-C subfamily serine protease
MKKDILLNNIRLFFPMRNDAAIRIFRNTVIATAFAFACILPISAHAVSVQETIQQVQPKMVKIYGAGGLRGLEAYQTGFLISPEGHILTVFSHVLDSDSIKAVLADGRKFEAKLLGADPRLEIAVLKIEASDLPCFDLSQAAKPAIGERILAFSNVFGVAMGDEPVSVQRGTISVATRLEARLGSFETPYRGQVYVLDVTTNNSGAAGGALVTRRGELLGMLGKELRNAANNTWLNYAIPIPMLSHSVDEIRAGKFVAQRDAETTRKPDRPLSLSMLGISLVPDILERTPPYVDHVRPGSPAGKNGIQPDDLVLLLGDRLIQSCKGMVADLESIDENDEVKLTILRGQDLVEVTLRRDTTETSTTTPRLP